MIKRKRTLIGLIVLLLFILYHFPLSSPDFFNLYPKEDLPARQLRQFLSRPLQVVVHDGVKWHYYRGGKGSQTILFIHGMGGAYSIWWQQILALEEQYRTISIDLPESIQSLEDAARGILAVLDAENIYRSLVVGTSMGGYIAQYLTDRYPERVEKVVFGNTFPPNKKILRENATIARILPWVPEALIRFLGNRQLQQNILPAAHESPLLAAVLKSLPFSKRQFLNRYRVVVDPFFPRSDRYAIQRIPKLIIESDNDPLIPPELREQLKARYADATVYTFHNEGHFPYINAAEKYTRVLARFFKEENEWPSVEAVIQQYFRGRREGNVALLQKVFNPQARIMTLVNGRLISISLSAYWKKVKQESPIKVQTRILDGTIQGQFATFTVAFNYPNTRYHDVLTLAKTASGWQIIEKVFQRLP